MHDLAVPKLITVGAAIHILFRKGTRSAGPRNQAGAQGCAWITGAHAVLEGVPLVQGIPQADGE